MSSFFFASFFLLIALPLAAEFQNLEWKLNTSNLGKFEEFKQLFAKYGYQLKATHEDVREADSDPLTVIVQKASQMDEHVLVEDTSLEVEGAAVGINVRWLLDHLPQFAGRKACWTVMLAYREGGKFMLSRGSFRRYCGVARVCRLWIRSCFFT